MASVVDGMPRHVENAGMADKHPHPSFAIGKDSGKLCMYGHAPSGLTRRISSDGLHWSDGPMIKLDRTLYPICAIPPECKELLAITADGKLVKLKVNDGNLESLAEIVMPDLPDRWYESSTAPLDAIIVHDKTSDNFRAFFGARKASGKDPERRGCIGSATSKDLREWQVEPPIFAPNQFSEMSSPRVFAGSGSTVMFYSAASGEKKEGIRCAIAPEPAGPFERLEPDILAKDVRRYLTVVPHGPRDLVFFERGCAHSDASSVSRPGVLEIRGDGTPTVRFFEGLLNLLGKQLFTTEASLESSELLVRVLPRYGESFRLATRVTFKGAAALGLLFRATMTGHDNMTLWLDYASQSLVARRGVNGRLISRVPMDLRAGEQYRLTLWVEGAHADVYIDDRWVLSFETEGRMTGGFGLAVSGGAATFSEVNAQTIEKK